MKTKLLALSLILSSFIYSAPVNAQYVGATTVQPARQVLIDKKILFPKNNQFVDNLNIEQHTFLPNQEITFRVSVTNVIQSDLKDLQISDKLPDVVNFVSTSFGNFDASSKTINLKIDSLKVGESKSVEIKTKVKPEKELSGNVTCQTNLARVTVNNLVDEDTATFCVSKQVLGTTTEMPKTGPAQTLPMLILSALFLAIGLMMRRIIILERR